MYDEKKYEKLFRETVNNVVVIGLSVVIISTLIMTLILLGFVNDQRPIETRIISVTVEILLTMLVSISVVSMFYLKLYKKHIYNNAIEDIRHYREDILTGLCRRTVLESRYEQYHKLCNSIGVIYIDLNDLKMVNDKYGHFVGDQLLIQAATAIKELRNEFQGIDHYRIGGDEFIIVVKNPTTKYFRQIATVIRSKISSIKISDEDGYLSAAVGLSYTSDGVNIRKLIAIADERMYEDKLIQKEANKK